MEKSPFSVAEASDTPWILWEKQCTVLELNEKPTDSLPVRMEIHNTVSPSEIPQASGIERKQYLSVVNRMHQAAGRVGAFARWDAAQT